MKQLITLILMFSSILCCAQKVECSIQPDTAFEAFRGKIAGNYVYMFLQNINDSILRGRYHYIKYEQNITLIGTKWLDSIYLFELDTNRNRTALIKAKIANDSMNGVWTDMKGNKKFVVSLYKYNATGDVYEINTQNNVLIFKYENEKYFFPISKYLDNKFNYSYYILFNEFIDNKLYAVVTFINFPSLQEINDKSGHGIDQFLAYSVYSKGGKIDTVQIIKVNSEKEGIKTINKFGSIYHTYKDSLSFDLFHIPDIYKYNIKISKATLRDGLIIKKELANYPIYLYDTLKLDIGDGYDLIRRYKVKDIDSNSLNYSFIVDSVYEKNNKSLNKLLLFCEALKDKILEKHDITTGDHNENVSFADYNFDGINDIFINTSYPDAPVSDMSQEIWLYNTQTSMYEKNEILSSGSFWGIDRKNKIIEMGSGSGTNYSKISYKYINRKFIVFGTEHSSVDKNGSQIIITRKLVNNKWIETKNEY